MTGKKTQGYDCLVIPGAAKMTTPFTVLPNQAFCGAGGLGYTKTSTIGRTVCCTYIELPTYNCIVD